jgi:hypothetical protein
MWRNAMRPHASLGCKAPAPEMFIPASPHGRAGEECVLPVQGDGADLRSQPWKDRREFLERLMTRNKSPLLQLSAVFDDDHNADEQRRHETENQAQARKLELDEPMEGAGALLSAEERPSETEAAWKRASREPKRLCPPLQCAHLADPRSLA